MSHFIVETLMANGDWDACWSEDDVPQTFDTREEAQAELDDFIDEMASAYNAGDIAHPYDINDYRIREIES